MRKLVAALFFGLVFAAPAIAQTAFPIPSLTVPIAGGIAAATRLIQAPAGKQIIVTALAQTPVATAVVTWTYGTGTNCGTGTTTIGPAQTFAAGQEVNLGNGGGPIMVIPPGNDLCITVATAAAPGWLTYTTLP